jgi:uncharacterized protein
VLPWLDAGACAHVRKSPSFPRIRAPLTIPMASATHDLLIRVTDLVDRPGASRRVDLRLPAPEDIDASLAQVAEPLRFTGVLESVVDGILVRGTLEATLTVDCARCLRTMQQEAAADVVELFTVPGHLPDDEVEPDAGYEIDEGHLDLDTLVRDALVPAIPFQPLCNPACKGLCSTCGADLNEVSCTCEETHTDPRWSALAGLELPEDGSR